MIRDNAFTSVISIMTDKEEDGTRKDGRGMEINARLGETCVTI